MAKPFNPTVEDSLAGVEILEGESNSGKLLAHGFGEMISEDGGGPFCRSPFIGKDEGLDQGVEGFWQVLFHN